MTQERQNELIASFTAAQDDLLGMLTLLACDVPANYLKKSLTHPELLNIYEIAIWRLNNFLTDAKSDEGKRLQVKEASRITGLPEDRLLPKNEAEWQDKYILEVQKKLQDNK